eukprot:1777893-Pyramimonas_sp.AAC.1
MPVPMGRKQILRTRRKQRRIWRREMLNRPSATRSWAPRQMTGFEAEDKAGQELKVEKEEERARKAAADAKAHEEK